MTSLRYLLPALLCLLTAACHSYEEWPDDALGNFDALATIIDEHYCYLDEKGVDWQSVVSEHRKLITPGTTQQELFAICSDMLSTLEDGHVNLASRFDTYYYRRWWTDYPQDFNLRTLQQYYLGFDWHSVAGLNYKVLTAPSGQRIGYIFCPSFGTAIGETGLSYAIASFQECDALIIDIRNNGGGLLTSVETLVRRFISEPYTAGYMRHKTGPGHNDFSEPYPITYKPCPEGQVPWTKPVAVLTNRSCFSAANDFTMAMKQLPQVTIIGARTGGGAGMPFSAGLPNGWNVRFSACPVTDAAGNSVEGGIDPTEGCEVHCDDADLAAGRDAILDFALNYFAK
ncbi:MAG: S41 family peptidase [Bacteroidales bacterium]|nr:S41 family peptidase [Bacteroidales bacterium]